MNYRYSILMYLAIIVFICPVFFPDSLYTWIHQGGKYYYSYDTLIIGFPGSDKTVPIKYYFQIISKDISIFVISYLSYFNIVDKLLKSLMVVSCTFFGYHAIEWVFWANDVSYWPHVIIYTIVFMIIFLRHEYGR